MKELGVVINCCGKEIQIAQPDFFEKHGDCQIMEVCIVYSAEDDVSLALLERIQMNCKSISTLRVNKNKSEHSAVRAGVRYMISNFRLPVIAVVSNLESYALDELLPAIGAIKEQILQDGLIPDEQRFTLSARNKRIVQILEEDFKGRLSA